MPDINYLKNGMFLYFDKQGNLKEQINDSPLRQGNSGVNKIYIFWEKADSENIVGLWSRYTRALRDTMDVKPSATTYFDDYVKVNGAIPFNDKRDLKFFQYYKEYEFYEITIPESVLGIGDTTWLCSLWFVLDQDNDNTNNGITQDVNGNVSGYDADEVSIFAMGGVAFYVIPLGLSIAPDENINIAQWNYLMWKLNILQNLYNQGLGGLEENIKSFNGRATDKTGVSFTNNSENAGETDYIVKIGGEYYNIYFEDRQTGVISFNGLINDLGSKAEASVMNTFAKSLVVSMDSSNYKISFVLKDANNNTISTQEIDLPIESVVVSGSYNSQTQSIILTLQNGNTISIPVSDLVSGLVSNTQLQTILQSYYTSSQVDAIADTKADAVDSAFEYNASNHFFMAVGNIGIGSGKTFEINDFSQLNEASSNKTLKQQLNDKANETNNAFSYNSTTGFYEAKNDLDMKGNEIHNLTEVYIGTLAGIDDNNIYLANDIDGNGYAINDIVIGTGLINLDTTNGAFIYANDEDVLSVSQYNDIVIGSDNVGTLTFRTPTNEVDFDDLMTSLNAKANASDINTLASSKIDDVKVNGTSLTKTTSNNVVSVNVDLSSYATNTDLKTYAKSLEVSMNTTTYVATFLLKDGNGNTLSTQTLDFPLESVVVNGTYDSTNQKIVLTLQNGNTIDIPVASLVSGLASQSDLNALTTRVGTLEINSAFTYNSSLSSYLSKGNIGLNGHTLKVDFDDLIDDDNSSLTSKLNAKADEINNAFTKNLSTGIYEAKNDVDFKGNDVDGIIDLTASYVFVQGIGYYDGSASGVIDLLNDVDGNGKDITNISLIGTKVIDLDISNNGAYISANDEDVLVVDENQNITIGSDNTGGTLTFRTATNEVDFDTLISDISGKADTSDVLLKTDATTTSTANKVVMRDGGGNIEGNYLKGTWLYSSNATDNASWSDVWVNNGGWLYKRAKASFKSDLGIPSGTLTTKENLTPQLLGYTQNSGLGNLTFTFANIDLTNKQGLGVFTYGNCNILINLYGLTLGTTYYQNCIYRKSGATTTAGLRNGVLAYSYYSSGSGNALSVNLYTINSDGTIGSIDTSGTQYTAYLFLVDLK